MAGNNHCFQLNPSMTDSIENNGQCRSMGTQLGVFTVSYSISNTYQFNPLCINHKTTNKVNYDQKWREKAIVLPAN